MKKENKIILEEIAAWNEEVAIIQKKKAKLHALLEKISDDGTVNKIWNSIAERDILYCDIKLNQLISKHDKLLNKLN